MIGMLHMIIAPRALSPPAVTFILDSSGPVVSWSPLSLTSVSLSLAQRLALDAMKEKKLQCVWVEEGLLFYGMLTLMAQLPQSTPMGTVHMTRGPGSRLPLTSVLLL